MTAFRSTIAIIVVFASIAAFAAIPGAAAAATRPPAPGHELTPGYVPTYCGEGEGTSVDGVSYGYSYAGAQLGWVSAPWCLPRWGNLTMSAPVVTTSGGNVTMTAIPDTNSAQYAPETRSITWRAPGTVVAGCGNADLTCTVQAPKAGPTWQWVEFQVSMPRVFFVDHPGSNCAGQHLCAGFTTHAWSVAGVPPIRELRVGGLVADVTGSFGLPMPGSCTGAGACDVKVDASLPGGSITTHQQLIDAQNLQNDARLNVRRELHQKILDLSKDVTEQRLKGTDKALKSIDAHIRASTDAAALQVADAGLESVFPAVAPTGAAPALTRRSSAGRAVITDASGIVRSLTRPSPSPADLRELDAALELARGPVYSADRARARVLLSYSLEAGRLVVATRLRIAGNGSAVSKSARKLPASIAIGVGTKRIASGKQAAIGVKLSPLGAQAVRLTRVLRTGVVTQVSLAVTNKQGSQVSRGRTTVRLDA